MTDPRVGLTRRYNGVDEILEVNGGKKRIQGTNFNALKTLKDPLYVKYADQLRQESKDSMNARLEYDDFASMLRRFTSENDMNHGQAEEIIRNQPTTPMQVDADKKKDDDEDMDDRTDAGDPPDGGGGGDDDFFNDDFPGPLGGDGRPPKPPPKPRPRRPRVMPQGNASLFQFDRRDQDGDDGKKAAESSQIFRRNLELEAQIAELREEIKRAARRQEAADAVKAAIPRENPTKEIIRELHQVHVAVPQQDPQVLSLLQQAMSSNQNMAAYAQQMGMTIVQFMAWARGQMNSQTQAAPASYRIDTPQPPLRPFNPNVAQVPASSGGGLRPPPPPAPKKIRAASPEMAKVAKAKAAIPPEAPPVAKPSAVQPKPTAAPIRPTEAPRPKPSAAPPKPSAAEVPVSRSRSRAASTATVDYGDTKVPASREVSRAKVPVPPRIASQPSRAASVATVDYGDSKAERSRSRTAGQEIVPNPSIILPIREEGRGRSPPRAQKIMEAIHKSQSRELVKGQMRQELGRFAKAFATKKREQPPPRAPSVPALPKTKTFDEIVAITEAREEAVKERAVPFGAAKQKQRTTSLGDARVRFQGRPVVA